MDSLEKRRNTYEKLNYYDLITLCIKRKDKIDELKKENEDLKIKLLEKRCSDKDIEHKEKIIYKQALLDIKEYIEKSYKEDYGNNKNYTPIEHLNLKNCTYERSLVVLDIVNKAIGEGK